MESKKLNYWLVFIVLVVSAFGVLWLYIQQRSIEEGPFILMEIPYEINNWTGSDIELPEEVFQILGTDKIIMREYKDEDEDIIWLYLVMAERDRTSFHPPEYCYLGGGKTELLEKEVIDIALAEETLTVNKLIFQMPAGRQVILVWYMAGDKFFANFYKQQFYLVLNIIRGKESGGAMVRLSTYFSQNNKEEKLNSLKQFLKDLQPHLIN